MAGCRGAPPPQRCCSSSNSPHLRDGHALGQRDRLDRLARVAARRGVALDCKRREGGGHEVWGRAPCTAWPLCRSRRIRQPPSRPLTARLGAQAVQVDAHDTRDCVDGRDAVAARRQRRVRGHRDVCEGAGGREEPSSWGALLECAPVDGPRTQHPARPLPSSAPRTPLRTRHIWRHLGPHGHGRLGVDPAAHLVQDLAVLSGEWRVGRRAEWGSSRLRAPLLLAG